MGDREYWQDYRRKLNSRLGLTRAGLEKKFDGMGAGPAASLGLTHQNIQDIQQMREDEEHLAAVERLLAGNGQLE
ncbi:hypothetical protein KRR38_30605 [Novosphingobium sp. G106]|uniref:hypothetical protein n=1 Tax=Novosphingobium sp. G106 TaxID=2849500 RepID=UPI001C2DEDC7|nr:hypothetical protein [Novosphingobium sp. G106]MBV1691900.1 hypothetical protein [Novosphingobium sp. G106]